ncbi:MAG: 4-coumarate--CoA ligase family protein [Vicinamibacterales bacterium]|jgi:acyl-CoA synthetase (AMP-forming)/AMP-acid ligase II
MLFRSPFPPVEIPRVALHDFVLGGSAARGDAPALVDGTTGRALSHAQLVNQTRCLAAGLAGRGIRQGDVVAIWSPNLPEYAVVFHAVSRLGAILTTVNPTYTVDELAYQLKDSGARLLITTAALLDKARAAIVEAGNVIELITIDSADGVPSLATMSVDAEPPPVVIDPDNDVVVMPYSSGTTGLPKGVLLTHRNLIANLLQIDAMEPHDMQALLGVLPFFHIYGMVVIMNFGLMRGATVVTLMRFDLETVLRILQDFPIAMAHVVPPVVIAFAKHPLVDRYDLSNLRWLFSGAAPLGSEITSAVETRLPIKVRQGYGMTELSPVTHYTPAGGERAGKVGLLAPSTELRVVDPATGADLGEGEAGEVWVRGPQVMKGYLNNPEATAQTIDADGWLHTGDVGVVDAEGYLEIVDRLKELIKVKAFQVAPAELEALLLRHPKIVDAAVFGVPDDECGEVPKAIVVIREPLTGDEVKAFVELHVAHYKRLRHVAFADAIPKSPSGKILRRVLVAAERAAAKA